MSLKNNVEVLADYNRWMNGNLYAAAANLSADELAANRGAFFKSVIGTLNHLLVADTIWLRRFSAHPRRYVSLTRFREECSPLALSDVLFSDLAELRDARSCMDNTLVEFVRETREADFEVPLAYDNTRGISFSKRFGHLVQHLFNHQTHHRGQLTALLSQNGIDYGVTDLLARLPDIE